jgi:hypothetical protein
MINHDDVIEAINRGVEETISGMIQTIDELYARDGGVKIPVTVTLTAAGTGGQIDVNVTTDLITNADEKPPPWKAERVKLEKRIRLNPAQRALPGQEV